MPPPDVALVARFAADLAALDAAPTRALPLGIAVSGGPDSLALLLLAAAACPGAIVAATVDHGLRPGATAEAAAVADLCATMSVPHRILAGDARGAGSVQDRARTVRYRLLGAWATETGIGWIATAHHLDDQAETFLMRAARGSGIAGLTGIRPAVRLAELPVPVIRPLLGWRRVDLAGIVRAAGIVPADDPSNRDPAYDRTRFRALLAATPLLAADRLAAAAAHLAEAEAAIDWTVARLAEERIAAVGNGLRLHDPAVLPREYRRRLLAVAVAQLAPAARPRGDSLDRLLRLLDAGRAGTLAGVMVRPEGDWIARPAPPRRNGN